MRRDIRVSFNGSANTRLVLNEAVSGKNLYEQKYLINTATSNGTDRIYPDRGTNLLKSAIGGCMVDENETMHAGNFAALDTLFFCSYEEHRDVFESEEYVQEYNINLVKYDNDTHSLVFRAVLLFKDGTSTNDSFNIGNKT